jgi:glucose/arabinose dehydrogenase
MMPFRLAHALASPLTLLALAPAVAADTTVSSDAHTLTIETVAKGLAHPWALAFIADDQFIVSERNTGTLRVGTADGQMSDPIWQAEDLFRFEGETDRSQSGMFDLQRHPEFDQNGWLYVSYSRQTDHGAAVVVVRGTVTDDDGEIAFEDVEDIFVMKEDDQDSSGLHFGGRMAFMPDGTLFLSIGERRNLERAQDASDQAGAILRMTDAGEAHAGNPEFDTDEDQGPSDPYLFSIGHRNIQALAVHPVTNEVWAVDHGPEGGDEINLIVAGNNYGWPFLTGGVDYSGAPMGVGLGMEGMTSPVHVFQDTVAPSGLLFVPEGTEFSEWAGDMLIGGMVTQGVMRVRLDGGEVAAEEAIEAGGRVRDLRIGPDNALWMVTDDENGAVLRVTADD